MAVNIKNRRRCVYYIDTSGVAVKARVYDLAQPGDTVVHVIRLVKWG